MYNSCLQESDPHSREEAACETGGRGAAPVGARRKGYGLCGGVAWSPEEALCLVSLFFPSGQDRLWPAALQKGWKACNPHPVGTTAHPPRGLQGPIPFLPTQFYEEDSSTLSLAS